MPIRGRTGLRECVQYWRRPVRVLACLLSVARRASVTVKVESTYGSIDPVVKACRLPLSHTHMYRTTSTGTGPAQVQVQVQVQAQVQLQVVSRVPCHVLQVQKL